MYGCIFPFGDCNTCKRCKKYIDVRNLALYVQYACIPFRRRYRTLLLCSIINTFLLMIALYRRLCGSYALKRTKNTSQLNARCRIGLITPLFSVMRSLFDLFQKVIYINLGLPAIVIGFICFIKLLAFPFPLLLQCRLTAFLFIHIQHLTLYVYRFQLQSYFVGLF